MSEIEDSDLDVNTIDDLIALALDTHPLYSHMNLSVLHYTEDLGDRERVVVRLSTETPHTEYELEVPLEHTEPNPHSTDFLRIQSGVRKIASLVLDDCTSGDFELPDESVDDDDEFETRLLYDEYRE